MKRLRQLHEEEQREARLEQVAEEFVAVMRRIERDHFAAQARISRAHRRMMLVVTLVLLSPVIAGILVFVIRRILAP
jgi:hypothetical protein